MDPILHNLFWKHPNKYYRKSKDIKLVREFELERDILKIRTALTEKLTKSDEATQKRRMPLQLEDKMISLFKKINIVNIPDELDAELQDDELDQQVRDQEFSIVEKSGLLN